MIDLIKNYLTPNIPLFIVEESTSGGTWFSEVASLINTISNKKINCFSICSKNEIIPSSKHLEEMVLVNEDDIYNSIINNLDI